MNRRGFLGLLSKLVAVGTAMSVAPEVLAPLKEIVEPVQYSQEEIARFFANYANEKPHFALAS
jgi:hypothetical protein